MNVPYSAGIATDFHFAASKNVNDPCDIITTRYWWTVGGMHK